MENILIHAYHPEDSEIVDIHLLCHPSKSHCIRTKNNLVIVASPTDPSIAKMNMMFDALPPSKDLFTLKDVSLIGFDNYEFTKGKCQEDEDVCMVILDTAIYRWHNLVSSMRTKYTTSFFMALGANASLICGMFATRISQREAAEDGVSRLCAMAQVLENCENGKDATDIFDLYHIRNKSPMEKMKIDIGTCKPFTEN